MAQGRIRVVIAKPGLDGHDGGIIPREDIAALKKVGVAEIFTPGAPTQKIVDWLRATLGQNA